MLHTEKFNVVGVSSVVREGEGKSFDILHLVGDPFFSTHNGKCVCVCYVGVGDHEIGDVVDVAYINKSYICVN